MLSTVWCVFDTIVVHSRTAVPIACAEHSLQLALISALGILA